MFQGSHWGIRNEGSVFSKPVVYNAILTVWGVSLSLVYFIGCVYVCYPGAFPWPYVVMGVLLLLLLVALLAVLLLSLQLFKRSRHQKEFSIMAPKLSSPRYVPSTVTGVVGKGGGVVLEINSSSKTTLVH